VEVEPDLRNALGEADDGQPRPDQHSRGLDGNRGHGKALARRERDRAVAVSRADEADQRLGAVGVDLPELQVADLHEGD
jgi:hypothetical protein